MTSAGRAASRDDINRVIIGLGGQGSRLVNEVRKAILKAGAEPEGVEFMAIDSDRISLGNLDAVPKENQVYLAAPEEKITETMVPWLPREFRPKAGGGCGMQRLTGKAMYLVHRQRIFEAINAVLRRLRQRTQLSNFMFVIVGAAGGGTGSGMLIDFSIDLRRNVSDVVGHEPMVFGLSVLPSRSETIQRANGVALLKELHFLLARKEPVVVGGRDVSNPFELFFVVGREVMGTEKDDELAQSIIRFTIDLGLIPSSSNEHATAGKGAGWVDLQDIRTIIKGASHMFATFGYYRAQFPADLLEEHLAARDALKKARARLPTFASLSDDAWKKLSDRKVALAEAARKIELARDRARLLRTGGILGVNRPALLEFQAELGRAEEGVRRLAQQLADAEAEIPRLEQEKQGVEKQIAELDRKVAETLLDITSPVQTQNTFTFPLTVAEVERVAASREILTEGNFLTAMDSLGRSAEYYDKTLEVIGKNKILFMPMLNYRMAFHTATLFDPSVLRALASFGFVKFDPSGNPVITDDQLWMVMAMLSTERGNLDPQKLSARAFKEIVENYIAKRAEVKTLSSDLKRHEVAIHSWMIGLQIAPIAPGYPPRLRELEWLLPEYEKLAREREIIQHHAFLYGDPLAFTELAGVTIDRMDVQGTNERITRFWSDYAPIDDSARWLQVPPIVAEAIVSLETVRTSLAQATRAAELPVPTRDTEAGGAELSAALAEAAAALVRAREALVSFHEAASEDEQSMVDRLRLLATQLEAAREGPRDPTRLARLNEMIESALADVAQTRERAEESQAVLSKAAKNLARVAREAAASQTAQDRVATTLAVRLRRALGELEEEAQRLDATVVGTIVVLHDLEEPLRRLLVHARTRSQKASAGPSRSMVPVARATDPRRPPAVEPSEADVLGRILSRKGEIE